MVEIEVAFLPDGSVRARVPNQDGVDFEIAAPTIDGIMRLLETDIPGLKRTTDVERHVHGPASGQVHTHQHAR